MKVNSCHILSTTLASRSLPQFLPLACRSSVRSSLSLPSSLRNWVILDYEEANGLTIRYIQYIYIYISMDWFKGKLKPETMGFYHQKFGGFRLKFSHHPVLWRYSRRTGRPHFEHTAGWVLGSSQTMTLGWGMDRMDLGSPGWGPMDNNGSMVNYGESMVNLWLIDDISG